MDHVIHLLRITKNSDSETGVASFAKEENKWS